MEKIKFTDGVEIVVSGPYRTILLDDGYYVVGNGDLIPVDSKEEADSLANELRRLKEKAAPAATGTAQGNGNLR
jgi:hypothetical protein